MSVVRAGGSSRCMPVSRVDRLCRSEPQAWETSHGPGYNIRGIRYEQRDTCGGGDCPGPAGSSAAFHCAPLPPAGPRGGRGGEGELEEGAGGAATAIAGLASAGGPQGAPSAWCMSPGELQAVRARPGDLGLAIDAGELGASAWRSALRIDVQPCPRGEASVATLGETFMLLCGPEQRRGPPRLAQTLRSSRTPRTTEWMSRRSSGSIHSNAPALTCREEP
jgi:hypothetical protein